jgi:hypothetical protein
MRGTVEQAVKKDGRVIERQRTDLLEAKKKCAEVNLRAVTTGEYNLQVIRCCQTMLKYHERVRDFKPEVVWIYGDSGSGKTRYVAEKCAEEDTYWKNSTKWWGGYDAHEVTVMDNFRASDMKMNELLKLIDRYPHCVKVKGGSRQMLSKKFYITSIKHPKDVYNLPEEQISQLLRRIDRILKI